MTWSIWHQARGEGALTWSFGISLFFRVSDFGFRVLVLGLEILFLSQLQ